jgi:beta-lactamase regulating signal transducer with metallopeptidase domain
VSQSVYESLLLASWQGAVMVAFVWVLLRLWRRVTPGARTWLWLIAVAKFLLVPLFVIELPVLASGGFSVVSSSAYESVTFHYGTVASSSLDPIAVCLVVWAIGVLVVLVKAVIDHASLTRFVREGAPASERISAIWSGCSSGARLFVHPSAPVPLVFGLMRPVVLLPQRLAATLSEDELRMVLAHEAAHLQRRDTFASLYMFVCFALFWFHPFVWLARREWQLDREAACDLSAIEATRSSAHDYAAMLLKVSAGVGRTPALALSAVPTYRTLQRRINDMKKTHNNTRSGKALWAVLATLVSAAALPFALTQRPNYGAGVFQTKGPDVTVSQKRKSAETEKAVLMPSEGVAQAGTTATAVYPTAIAVPQSTTGTAYAPTGGVATSVSPAYAPTTTAQSGYAPTGGVATTASPAYAPNGGVATAGQATTVRPTAGARSQVRPVEEPARTTSVATGGYATTRPESVADVVQTSGSPVATAVDVAPSGRTPSSVTIVLRDKATAGGKGLDAPVSIDVEDVDLVDFLKFLGSTAKVKIKAVGVRSGMRLNADIQNATLGEVMGTIAKTYRLEWKLEGDGSITVRPFRS